MSGSSDRASYAILYLHTLSETDLQVYAGLAYSCVS